MNIIKTKILVPIEVIADKIYLMRNRKVMIDKDLAKLYEVETKVLNQSVKRNIGRFPDDFMFALNRDEILRMSQIVTSLKYSKSVYVFTEQGIAMLSSILKSERAVQVNIQIMRAFIKIREMILSNKDLIKQIELLELRYGEHDKNISVIFEAIKELLKSPEKKKIGF